MKDWKRYLYQPKPASKLLNDSTIVIDTNVLLAAYQWREVTVNKVLTTLQRIKDEDRLRIPLQVIKEFSKNRTKEIKQRMNDIDQVISKLQRDKSPIRERVPMLEGKDILKNIETLQENHHKALKEYKDGLVELRDHLKRLFYEDHFLDRILEISEGAIIFPPDGKTDQDLMKEAEERFKNKIPPGYKDDPKEENSSGDFIIWSSILQLDTNVVFVSGDKKSDWVYKDKNEKPIVARRELIEEFFIQTGKDFAHITPKEFITYLNPDVDEYVKEDLSSYKSNQESPVSLETLSDNFKKISELTSLICKKYMIPQVGGLYGNLEILVDKGILDRISMERVELLHDVLMDMKYREKEDALPIRHKILINTAINTSEEILLKLLKLLDEEN
ncbi:PIN domain-containing protein [Bacillus subtilis]|uniref:PIN-like domain-containing protein n=1 Tax=Bacillus subtilis TaxID=1423 RepID=UPI001D06EFB0|nr:PIN domain-containing protein [Bacillus subtilis]MCB7160417.1 PIN domain-containing protein [Bacillus subtilis]MCB7458585.1 PIN domain-containing protein [Bacillus subtilis]